MNKKVLHTLIRTAISMEETPLAVTSAGNVANVVGPILEAQEKEIKGLVHMIRIYVGKYGHIGASKEILNRYRAHEKADDLVTKS